MDITLHTTFLAHTDPDASLAALPGLLLRLSHQFFHDANSSVVRLKANSPPSPVQSSSHCCSVSWSEVVMAANTPMLLKAGLVEGNTEAGVLASGQVAGIIDDLPSCAELIDDIVADAVKHLTAAAALVE